jgi:integrase
MLPHSAPTRTPKTVKAYLNRYEALMRSVGAYYETDDPSVDQAVDWLIDIKRLELDADSWRQYRASMREGFEVLIGDHPAVEALVRREIDRLNVTKPAPLPDNTPLRTSAGKAKKLSRLDRLCARIISSRSPNVRALVAILRAAAATGLRPSEWRAAKFERIDAVDHRETSVWRLTVRNAKNSNGRSTGPIRTLFWRELGAREVEAIRDTIIEAARQDSEGKFDSWLATLGRLLYAQTRALDPRRKSKHVTLYTPRHEAAARWKSHYVKRANTAEEWERGLAIVAALLGHISDATASRHYGRVAGSADRMPIPVPLEREVLLVRKRMAARLEKLRSLHADARPKPNPH